MFVSTRLARLTLNCVCVGYVKPFAGVRPLSKLAGTQEVCTHQTGAAGWGGDRSSDHGLQVVSSAAESQYRCE